MLLGTNEIQSFTPPNKALYDGVVNKLSANSRHNDNVMRQLRHELTTDMTPQDMINVAIAGETGAPIRPLDTLSREQNTPDVRAMINIFSQIESTRSRLPPDDLISYTEYAYLYENYRMLVLDANLTLAREGQSQQYLALKKQYDELGVKLHEIQYKNTEGTALRTEIPTLHKVYTSLIEGQAEARLNKIGKSSDPLLYDPTIKRVTEADIRSASYQYRLIIGALLPKSNPPSPQPTTFP